MCSSDLIKNFVVVSGQGEVHKTLFLLFCFLFLLHLKNAGGGGGGEDVVLVARVATGRGSTSGEYFGRGMSCGTTNPS